MSLAVAPELLRPMEAVSARMAADKAAVDGTCLTVDVRSATPGEVVKRLSKTATPGDPRLWVPDTSRWLELGAVPRERIEVLNPSIAASPLVLATTSASADKLSDHAQTWESLAQAAKMALPDPRESGTALSALIAIKLALPGNDAHEKHGRFGGNVFKLVNIAPSKTLDRPVPMTEQQVMAYQRERSDGDLEPVVPRSGTVLLDYPLVALSRDTALQRAGQVMTTYIQKERKTFQQAGFRDPSGATLPEGSSHLGKVTLLAGGSPADPDEATRTWVAMRTPARMLGIVDLSASMRYEADKGRSRIVLARDAAVKALAYFPSSAEIGMWGFSHRLDGNKDYKVFVPMGGLDTAQKGRLAAALSKMVGAIGGGTGLYDTILAGYQASIRDYKPNKINSLVLLTDGRNELDPGGISKGELLRKLRALQDPKRPITTVFVGMGPDAANDVLGEIARATGGQAYVAREPKDMERIVISAFLSRKVAG